MKKLLSTVLVTLCLITSFGQNWSPWEVIKSWTIGNRTVSFKIAYKYYPCSKYGGSFSYKCYNEYPGRGGDRIKFDLKYLTCDNEEKTYPATESLSKQGELMANPFPGAKEEISVKITLIDIAQQKSTNNSQTTTVYKKGEKPKRYDQYGNEIPFESPGVTEIDFNKQKEEKRKEQERLDNAKKQQDQIDQQKKINEKIRQDQMNLIINKSKNRQQEINSIQSTINSTFATIVDNRIKSEAEKRLANDKRELDRGFEELKKGINNGYSTKTCDRCDGKGENECKQCNGEGKKKCTSCLGSGKDFYQNKCVSCNGLGKSVCVSCLGMGAHQCIHCNGTGSEIDYNSKKDEPR